MRKRPFSANCPPMSCSPTGSPSDSPHGMERPGNPARHDGIVSRSQAYIASGSAARSPIGECHRRRCRRDDRVEAFECLAVLPDEERAHPLRLAVERVVVARRERVRAEHDATLRLGAEAFVPRPIDHLAVRRALDARPEAHAVVAREVRRRLGRRDEVVARHSVAIGEREVALPHLGAELACAARARSRTLRGHLARSRPGRPPVSAPPDARRPANRSPAAARPRAARPSSSREDRGPR